MFQFLIACVVLMSIVLIEPEILGWNMFKKKKLPGISTIWDVFKWNVPSYWGLPNYVVLEKGQEFFGAVFQFKIGSNCTVAINDLNLAKKIMSSSDWQNRLPKGHVIFERSFKEPLGILFGNGRTYTALRDFTARTLSSLGFGKGTSMEPVIVNEMDEVVAKLQMLADQDGVFSPHGFFHISTLNILWNLIAGSRFSHDDPELQELLKYFYEWNRSFNLGATPLHCFPWLRHIPKLTEHDAWVVGHAKFADFFKKIMVKRLADKKYLDEPNDYIDHFLREMAIARDGAVFNEKQFVVTCTDLFMAGADTTSNTFEYAILFMALNPDIQKKVQEEIYDVIGMECSPSLVFRSRMPYTEATAAEIFRHSCAVPITGRCPLEDMEINECPIPKGSLIAINIHGINNSKDVWSDPKSFRPERFLSPEGTIINQEKILPFGYGKRKCLGEATARNTFFLFFTAMLQKFTFEISSSHPPPSLEDVCGLSRAPKPYFVKVKTNLTTSS